MSKFHGALGAGHRAPTSDETPSAGTTRGLREQGDERHSEYGAASAVHAIERSDTPQTAASEHPQNATSAHVHRDNFERKHFATLQARAALAGVALSCIEDDSGRTVFIASKWAMTKEMATLAEVERLLLRIGGQHAG